MLPGPVFQAELLTTARRARYYVARALYGSILLGLVGINYSNVYRNSASSLSGRSTSAVSISAMARFADQVFTTFAMTQVVMVLALTPVLVAGSVVDERRRRTLDYLLASRLSGAEIVLGKLGARLLHVGVFLGVGLPILSLLSLFGGLDPWSVVLVYAGTLSAASFLGGLSILVSTFARRVRDAVVTAYLLELSWICLPPIIDAVAQYQSPVVYEWAHGINAWFLSSNPLAVLGSLSGRAGGTSLAPLAWMIGIQFVLGMTFAGVATWRLRPAFRNQSGEPARHPLAGGRRRFGRTRRVLGGRWRLSQRPACGDDPVLWKEIHVARMSGVVRVLMIALSLVFAAIAGYWFFEIAAPAFRELAQFGYGAGVDNQHREEFNVYLRTVGTLIYVAWALGAAGTAASGVTSEHEGDTWTSLIGTPLEGADILRPKMLGAAWGLRWFGAAILLLWTVGLVAGSVSPLGYLAALVELIVFMTFAAALGTYVSLRSKTSMRAQATTAAILVTMNFGYLMCCVPLGGLPGSFYLVPCTPYLLGVSLVSYDEFRQLLDFTKSNPSLSAQGIFLGVVAGVLGYGLAAVLLIDASFRAFDRLVGRPRKGRFRPQDDPKPRPKPEPLADDDAIA